MAPPQDKSYAPLDEWGDQGDGTFCNPVIWADFNNPWLLQVESDFYLTAASHHFMGMPVLHSRDLINWKLIGRIYEKLDFDEKYGHPGQAYQQGSWAPCLVYHAGRYWMYCMNSTDGLFMTTANHPSGPWAPVKLVHRAHHWEDPFPFWDDDGQAYLIRSGFGGNAPLVVYRMASDGQQLLDDGFVLSETLPNVHNPMLIKRDQYYYLFGATAGLQKVFRSRYIYGPYEERCLLVSKGVGSSPGGGGWIELPNGECWFMHHVGIPGHGRLPFLQPAGWKDGWPWIGVNINENGTGQVVWRIQKPQVGENQLPCLPVSSDDFELPNLGLQWRWNHNPVATAWSLTQRPGWLRMWALPLEHESGVDGVHQPVPFATDSLVFARNTLAQLMLGRRCQATACVDISGIADGQRAGLSLFNRDYLWVGVVQEEGKRRVQVRTPSAEFVGPLIDQNILWLRVVNSDGVGKALFSLDGETFSPLGDDISLSVQWFEAHKFAVFTYTRGLPSGWVDFDSVLVEML